MKVFDAEASVSLAEYFESTNNDSIEDQNSDVTEEEVEIIVTADVPAFFALSSGLKFLTFLPIFVPSYIPTIDIPPLF